MSKIWQKTITKSNPIVEKYNTGDDYIMDMEIFPFDVKASIAHVRMLSVVSVIEQQEADLLVKELEVLLDAFNKGEVVITVEDEDCHTVIENFLIEKLGDIGKKVHTGRSRNDQVLTALRLYTLHKMQELASVNVQVMTSFLDFVERNKNTPLPGYTHTQQAMLSSFGHWGLSFVEGLINDHEVLRTATEVNNQNPLGTAAGFGVSLPLDRDSTKRELGFTKNIVNSLFAQASRGKFESLTLEALAQIMLTLSRFATDMLFFTARETGFVKVSDAVTTGSSIMPQKKNLDSMELLRGNASVIFSHQLLIKNIPKGVISGYNRDLQLIKKPLIESLQITYNSLLVVDQFLKDMTVDSDAVKKAIKKDIFAADVANEMVEKEGVSFRDAYIQVWQTLDQIEELNLEENILSKKSLGSPGNLDLEYYQNLVRVLNSK